MADQLSNDLAALRIHRDAHAEVQTAKAELADATQKAKRECRLATQGVGAAALSVKV